MWSIINSSIVPHIYYVLFHECLSNNDAITFIAYTINGQRYLIHMRGVPIAQNPPISQKLYKLDPQTYLYYSLLFIIRASRVMYGCFPLALLWINKLYSRRISPLKSLTFYFIKDKAFVPSCHMLLSVKIVQALDISRYVKCNSMYISLYMNPNALRLCCWCANKKSRFFPKNFFFSNVLVKLFIRKCSRVFIIRSIKLNLNINKLGCICDMFNICVT